MREHKAWGVYQGEELIALYVNFPHPYWVERWKKGGYTILPITVTEEDVSYEDAST